ncbi:GntR family transcriptional regulator [Aliirhizobium smilacinae]|uniref:GntR family transcriptional regulator n=1 Tax=Aliirhizobium smilacinae TaxID=1395944 RepID=A0A5C4XKP5_9HYPH|nr:GntR family transcriptional regulator [Rhizobium smilacinae]TNM63054.1 GntR family transcriptional regulator [Rhizobium smilacinae]
MLSTPGKRLAVQAYDQVLEPIVSRRLASDTVIQERKLSEHLNMSRTPLRDALLMLEGEGLLIRNEGRGLRVRSMDIVDFVENLAVRDLLEPEAVRLAAGQIEDHKLADIERAVAAILEGKMSGMPTERESVRAVDEKLHATIMLAAGNKQMASLIRSLRSAAENIDFPTGHDTVAAGKTNVWEFRMAAGTTASTISTDIVAKLSEAIENLETMESDEMLVVLNEALDVIRELVQMLDAAGAE